MTIEMIALAGFVFAAAALAAVAYERHMDVLHGPYIEGRSGRVGIPLEQIRTPIRSTAEYFRWKAGILGCLSVMIAG